jgi:hypothetical protein
MRASYFERTMKKPRLLLPVVCCFFSAVALTAARAEEPVSRTPKTAARLDSHALDLLRSMGATLGAAKALTYRSSNTVEVPARTGQFITLFPEVKVALKRPDKLRVQLSGEAPPFDFYYDGATASAFAPRTNLYSVSKAPPTIDAMLPALQQETGIRFASAPLLFSDPYSVLSRGLLSAIIVGPSAVNGTRCEHLAFRSPGVNWEIWIETGPRPLPRRLAVTFTDRTNFPRVLVEFSNWNLHPWLKDSDFVFRKPAGAREIPFLSAWKSNVR